ncbi:MAG: YlbL family protein [Nitriliruptorales bacterium]
MRRALLVLLAVSAVAAVGRGGVSCGVLALQPRCYVAVHPGPADDAIAMVGVSGARTYASSGQILLTTVAVDGDLDPFEWVTTAFSRRVDQMPREVLFPPGTAEDEVQQHNIAQMDRSQLVATAAALRHLGHAVDLAPHGAEVVELTAGMPAEGVLEPGDVIVRVDGEPVDSADAAADAIAGRSPGDTVRIAVRRGPETAEVDIELAADPEGGDRALVGALLRDHIPLPVDVTIDAGSVGGPSAGLSFALAIVDLLTPEDLTGGAVVGTTGSIALDGTVGPIGGIQQKIIGALDRGGPPATVFLVPEGNAAEARATAVDRGVLVVPVGSLQDALDALDDVRSGREPRDAFALGR